MRLIHTNNKNADRKWTNYRETYIIGNSKFQLLFIINSRHDKNVILKIWKSTGWIEIVNTEYVDDVDDVVKELLEVAIQFNDGE